LVVNSTADQVDASPGDGVCATSTGACTLRAAIQEANALPGLDTVILPAGTFNLTLAPKGADDPGLPLFATEVDPTTPAALADLGAGDLDILDDLDLKGAGPALTIIDAGGASRVLDCWPPRLLDAVMLPPLVRVSNVQLMGGHAWNGGGVLDRCRLELHRVRLFANDSDYSGGGLYAQRSPLGAPPPGLSMVHVRVDSNQARYGGGVEAHDAPAVLLRDGLFDLNVAVVEAGGMLVDEATVLDSSFTNNSCTGFLPGGGLNIRSGSVGFSTFERNTAATHGGGLYLHDGRVTNCTFSQNEAPDGQAVSSSGHLELNNLTFFRHLGLGSTVFSFGRGGATLVSNSLFRDNTESCAGAGVSSAGHNVSDFRLCGTPTSDDVSAFLENIDLELRTNIRPPRTLALLTPRSSSSAFPVDSGNPATPGSSPTSCEQEDARHFRRPMAGLGTTGFICDPGAFELSNRCPVSSPDTDEDGIPDACDPDDDNDDCTDGIDQNPLLANPQTGTRLDLCQGSRPATTFEGEDSDGDGLTNCEDDDDDDDGIADDSDDCLDNGISCTLPTSAICLDGFWPFACLGGGCVQYSLRLVQLINPQNVLIFQEFSVRDGAYYAQPRAGEAAAQTAAAISALASGKVGFFGLTGAATNARSRPSPPPLAGVRLEIWFRESATAPEKLWNVIGEYRGSSFTLGSLSATGAIRIDPGLLDGRKIMKVETAWASGANSAKLPDVDADQIPDAFDRCRWIPGDENCPIEAGIASSKDSGWLGPAR